MNLLFSFNVLEESEISKYSNELKMFLYLLCAYLSVIQYLTGSATAVAAAIVVAVAVAAAIVVVVALATKKNGQIELSMSFKWKKVGVISCA